MIKSHHNVGGLPERMNLKLVEPLRELFMDEVCTSAASSGAPSPISAQGRCRLSRSRTPGE